MVGDSIEFNELEMAAFDFVGVDAVEIEEEALTLKDSKPIEDLLKQEDPEEVDEGSENDDDDREETLDNKEISSQSNIYSSLVSALVEEGLLPSLKSGQKIESAEELVKAFQTEIKANEYADLTDGQKQYLEGIRAGIPEEVIKASINITSQLESIGEDEITENEELRKQLILQDYLSKGYNQEKAERLTQRSIDSSEDVADALDALASLKEIQKKEYQLQLQEQLRLKQEHEESNAKQLDAFKKNIFETKEIIPGVPINTTIAEKVWNQAMNPVGTTKSGTPLNAIAKARIDDPIGFETKLNYLFYITNGFSDFTKIQKSQKKKVIEDLDKVIRGNEFVPVQRSITASDFDPKFLDNIKI